MGKRKRRDLKSKPDKAFLAEPLSMPERKAKGHELIKQLDELGLRIAHTGMRTLLSHLAQYIHKGERVEIDVPLPDANRRAVGVLSTSRREETWLRLERL